MLPDAEAFANAWIASWNSHDLEDILGHYADDIEVTTPMIRLAAGMDSDTLCGKQQVRDYWAAALRKLPDLHFELIDYASGVDSIALYYKSVMNKLAIEVMFFDANGKVVRMIAHYH